MNFKLDYPNEILSFNLVKLDRQELVHYKSDYRFLVKYKKHHQIFFYPTDSYYLIRHEFYRMGHRENETLKIFHSEEEGYHFLMDKATQLVEAERLREILK